MDGKDLTRRVNRLLNEDDNSSFLDSRTTYDYLYEAAKEWVRRTNCLTSSQDITTVADTAGYTLEGDFLGLYLKNKDNNYYVVLNDGSNNHFINFATYSSIIYADQSDDSKAIPDSFTIIDDTTLDDQISGTCSVAGDDTGGKSLLTTTSSLADVTPGDIVHNTTDGSDGVVISVESSTTAYTALFGGTDNEWDSSDSFIIQPRGRYKIYFDPPPSTADYTVTVHYIQRPQPVYSDYDVYRIGYDYADALSKYAYWLYKYRDREPNLGDSLYKYWDDQIRKATAATRHIFQRKGFTMNLRKRR